MVSVKNILSKILYPFHSIKPNSNEEQIGSLFMNLHHALTSKEYIKVDDMAFRWLLRSGIVSHPEFSNAGFKEEDMYSFLGLSKEQYNSNVCLTQDQEFDIHLGYYLLFNIRWSNLGANDRESFDLEKVVLEDLISYAEHNIPESEKEIKSRIFDLTREDFNEKLDRLKKLVKKEQ